MLFAFLRMSLNGQNADGLIQARLHTMGDLKLETNQEITFGLGRAIGVSSLGKGCMLTFNHQEPIRTLVMAYGEKNQLTVVTETHIEGKSTKVSPLMSVPAPMILWTDTWTVRCQCPAGSLAQLAEYEKP